MIFGIMLFILVILAEKNHWDIPVLISGFWTLSLMELTVELSIVYRLLAN